ncbi:hypothetical protein [Salimicrobium flavidum]|uniref:Uncharacterized protein n=1 Tax=Salimicrobium flavidum TaxID=570947 RepID=A0A1N7J0N1_9BACI|nr:hypothetical protein [Salimicrobium flavidum]SIS42880.1 hypothetical protein SAMN05421687_103123 [Salimicrobium flavidum]
MSNYVKDQDPVLKDVAGLAKALKIESGDLGKERQDLELVLHLENGEKRIPFQYHEEKGDYRILQIPMTIADDTIMNGRVEPKAVDTVH